MLPYRAGHLRSGDGLRLAWRDYPGGSGLPLLCLAGMTRNASDFDRLAQHLQPGRRVLTLDLRGRGDSQWDPSGRSYRPPVYVDDVRQLLAAFGLGRIAVCGTSLGGFLAMGLAVAAPMALAGVILNDAGPDPDLTAFAAIKHYINELVAHPPADWEAAKAALKAALPHLGLRSEADWDAFTAGTFVERDGRLAVSWDPALNRSLERGGPLPDLWPYFRALTGLPVLLFRGENSPLLRPETVARMRALHPAMETITVPHAGHTPTLLEPESLGPLDDFLDRLDRRAR